MTRRVPKPLSKLKQRAMLAPETRTRCGRLIRLLGSPEDGEALGAARGLGRVLSAGGADFNDLAAEIERGRVVVPLRQEGPTGYNWRETARWCAQRAAQLAPKDRRFVLDLHERHWRRLSAGQEAWLADIAARLGRAAA
jgi:hypothetical protein